MILKELLATTKKKAKDTAKVIAFSLRFKTIPERAKLIGGLTTARKVLELLRESGSDSPDTLKYHPRRAISSIRNYWDHHQLVYILIYLAYFENVKCLRAPEMDRAGFPTRLIRLVNDRPTLMNCFSRHNAILRYLNRYRGYHGRR
jgi:hypothetical protein